MKNTSNKIPKFSIIMANYNGYYPTSGAIKSLKKLTYPNYEIIVVDDCSTDDSLNKLKAEFPNVIYLSCPQNGGLNKSYNIGLNFALKAGSDYLYTCQNDTYDYSENILEAILNEFQSNPKIGMVGTTIIDSFGNYRWNGIEKNKLGVMMNTSECFVVKREVYEKIGLFNEKLKVYFEDLDLIIRLRKSGFETSAVTSVQLTHSGQVTFSKQSYYPNYLRSRNLTFFINHYHTKALMKKSKPRVLLYNIIANFIYMLWPRVVQSFKNWDITGIFYLLSGYFIGVISGLFLKWKEEKPWTPQNKYPHY